MSRSSIYGGLRFLPPGKHVWPAPLCHPCRGLPFSTYIPTAPAVGYVVASRDSRHQICLMLVFLWNWDLTVEVRDL